MPDNFSPQERSQIMAAIKSENTKPELLFRHIIFNGGFRYGLHNRKLPGVPDLSMPKYKTVVFIHGCFWHKHKCNQYRSPKSKLDYWSKKLETNKKRDVTNIKLLRENGWKVLIVWECALKGKNKLTPVEVLEKTQEFLESETTYKELP